VYWWYSMPGERLNSSDFAAFGPAADLMSVHFLRSCAKEYLREEAVVELNSMPIGFMLFPRGDFQHMGWLAPRAT